MKNTNLTEESTTLKDIAHTGRNENITRNEDKSYTKNTEPIQNPRYNNSNYNTCYDRYESNKTHN